MTAQQVEPYYELGGYAAKLGSVQMTKKASYQTV